MSGKECSCRLHLPTLLQHLFCVLLPFFSFFILVISTTIPFLNIPQLERRRTPVSCIANSYAPKEQFLGIGVKVSPKLNEEISRMIGEEVWKTSKDIRDVISLGKLIRKDDGPEEIERLVKTLGGD